MEELSNYLYEYAQNQYKDGKINDAIHEARKSLIANPYNCAARAFLRRLIPQNNIEVDIRNSRGEVLGLKKACPDDSVIFEAKISGYNLGRELSYVWDFGDGQKMSGDSLVEHKYSKGGKYLVRLSLNDKDSPCPADMAKLTVKVNHTPIANAGKNLACCPNSGVFFDASGSSDLDSDALRYNWDFGDGLGAEGKIAKHAYNEAGEYNVVLTVSDNSDPSCNSGSDSFVAIVAKPPVAVIELTSRD